MTRKPFNQTEKLLITVMVGALALSILVILAGVSPL